MACDRKQKKTAQTAATNGISEASSQNGYVAGSTARISPALPPKKKKSGTGKKSTAAKKRAKRPAAAKKIATARIKTKSKRPKTQSTTTKQRVTKTTTAAPTRPNKTGQASFFEVQAKTQDAKPLPTQRQIKISNDFTPEELRTISIQLGFGAAAVSRHICELKSESSRGVGHSDPRPLDWAQLDQKNFQFLANQVAKARGGEGYIDTSSLKSDELFDLWEFSKFEADRAQRNIDHLFSGGSHLKGPTAEYLADRHKLEARFYTFMAGQLEPMITPDMLAKHYIGL